MTAAWAVLGGLLGLVILLFREAIKDMCRSELKARLSQLPQALLWLAVRQLPKKWRDELGGEWRYELDEIRRVNSETPLTALAYGIFFAAGLFIRARSIARGYAGRPQAFAMVWDTVCRLALSWIPFSARNRTTGLDTGDLAPAVPGSGNGAISIRRPVAIAAGLALTAGTALALYTSGSGHGLKSILPTQGQLNPATLATSSDIEQAAGGSSANPRRESPIAEICLLPTPDQPIKVTSYRAF